MSINGILQTGLSAILTNAAALRVTGNNIANVNTEGYVRRVIHQETLAPAGQLGGVTLGDIERAANAWYDREAVAALGAFSRYDTLSNFMDQLNAALGSPGAGSSLSSRLDAVYAALGQASLDPALLANRQGVLYQFQSLAQSISDLSQSIAGLRQSADQKLGVLTGTANDLIKQIFDINFQIQRATSGGEMGNALLDQRDMLIQDLAELVGIRTVEQPDGRIFIATLDGVSLVGDAYGRITHLPSSGPAYNPLTIETIDARTGQVLGAPREFDSHASGGELRGLIDMRDQVLQELGDELGAFAQGLSLAMNAQHNANTAIPPPTSMTGRQTGLLGSDVLNFSGQATIGLTSSNGTLQHSIAIDFTAGTLSVDGGGAVGFAGTIDDFVTALDTALGADGSASFTDGVLSLSANGGSGIVITGEPGNAATRGGIGFSHFFGLNDLFQASGNAIQTTGLSAGDTAGFAPGGTVSLLLKGPNGERAGEVDVSITGATIGDVIGELNTAMAAYASFALDANGRITMTPAAGYQSYDLEVKNDTTVRGATGASFTSLFGLGSGEASRLASSFALAQALENAPQRLALAQSSLTSATALGTIVGGAGDNRGLLALQALGNTRIPFASGGALPGRNTTLGDYAATFYQDIAARGQFIDANRTAQDARLSQAKVNQSQAGGVNLDEELAQMMTLQQAYNAGARVMRVADELLQELLTII